MPCMHAAQLLLLDPASKPAPFASFHLDPSDIVSARARSLRSDLKAAPSLFSPSFSTVIATPPAVVVAVVGCGRCACHFATLPDLKSAVVEKAGWTLAELLYRKKKWRREEGKGDRGERGERSSLRAAPSNSILGSTLRWPENDQIYSPRIIDGVGKVWPWTSPL